MVDVVGVIVVVHAREDFAETNTSVVKQFVSKADAANGVVIGFTGIRDGIVGDFRTRYASQAFPPTFQGVI